MNKLITIINAMPAAIIASIITILVTNIKEYLKDTKTKRKYAAIIYYDMSRSLDQINYSRNNGRKDVFQNKFSHLNKDKFFEYLITIRDKISEKDYHNIIVYYDNLWFLESIRENYWSEKDHQKRQLLGGEYVTIVKTLGDLYEKDEQGFKNTIEVVKKIAKVEDYK